MGWSRFPSLEFVDIFVTGHIRADWAANSKFDYFTAHDG